VEDDCVLGLTGDVGDDVVATTILTVGVAVVQVLHFLLGHLLCAGRGLVKFDGALVFAEAGFDAV